MKELLKQLKQARSQRYKVRELYEAKLKEFNESISDITTKLEQENNNILGIETDIKELAIKEYNQTGKKKLECGVGIRVMSRLIYEQEDALKWAQDHNLALTLDKKAFESIAKTQAILFVEKREIATATIPMKINLEDNWNER